jgi:outer membrane protein
MKVVKSIFFLIFIVSYSFAQQSLSLRKAIEIGLQNNYSIRLAESDADITEQNRKAAVSALMPRIDANATYNKSIVDTRQLFVTGVIQERDAATTTQNLAGLQMSWVLFDGLKMFASYDRIKELEKMGEQNAKAAVQSVLADIIINYYAIVASQVQLKANADALEVSKKRVEVLENKVKVGSGSTLDLLNAKVDYNSDYSNYLRQQENLKNLKIRLNELLILPVNDDFTPSDSIPTNTLLNTDDLYNKLLIQNPMLINAKSQQRIAELNVKEVSADRYPTIRLNSGYNYSNVNAQAGFVIENRTQGLSYGVTASVNIFNGLLQSRREKTAKIQSQAASMSYEVAKLTLETNWSLLLNNYKNNFELLRLERENQLVAKRNIDISVEKYHLGGISSLQLREAQKAYIDANSRYVNALYQFKLAETSLLELSSSIIP